MTTDLERALTPFKRRLQWQNSLRTLWLTLIVGFALACILLGLGRLWPLLLQGQLLFMGLMGTGVLVGLGQIYVWFKPRPVAQLARLGDRYLGLDERLVTAVELESGLLSTRADLGASQQADALARLRQAPVSLKVPIFNPKPTAKLLGIALGLFLVLELLYFWPNPQEAIVQQQIELDNLLEAEIAKLEEIQSDLLETVPDLSQPQLEDLSATLDELVAKLAEAREAGSPEQTLAALAEAEQTLEALNQARSAQEQAFNQLADSLAESGLEAAQDAAEALQEGNLNQAADALEQLAQSTPSSASEAQSLADSLNQAASDLATTNPNMAQNLQQAADALQSGNQQAVQEALQQAAQQLAEAQNQQAGQAQLSQALENIDQARQQLAQQGQGQGEGQQGQQGQGQGQGEGQGQGAGQNQANGQGQGGSGREDPDGNVAEGIETDQGQPGPMSTDNGANQNRLEDYDSVYAPQHIGGDGGPFIVPDQQGSDGQGVDIGETPPNPNRPTGEATVPYRDVYGQYQDQASTALDNEEIPISMRDYIRQYFGALEPGQ